jgi:hypothetical protein
MPNQSSHVIYVSSHAVNKVILIYIYPHANTLRNNNQPLVTYTLKHINVSIVACRIKTDPGYGDITKNASN